MRWWAREIPKSIHFLVISIQAAFSVGLNGLGNQRCAVALDRRLLGAVAADTKSMRYCRRARQENPTANFSLGQLLRSRCSDILSTTELSHSTRNIIT